MANETVQSKVVEPEEEDEESINENQNQTIEATEADIQKVSSLTDASEKPRYDRLTELTIESVGVRKSKEAKVDGNGDKYYSWRVIVKYSDKSTESFGGLRQYPDRTWYGPDSAYGEVKGMLETHIEAERKLSLQEFVKELYGKKVKVKSRDWKVGNQTGYKNIPIEFAEE